MSDLLHPRAMTGRANHATPNQHDQYRYGNIRGPSTDDCRLGLMQQYRFPDHDQIIRWDFFHALMEHVPDEHKLFSLVFTLDIVSCRRKTSSQQLSILDWLFDSMASAQVLFNVKDVSTDSTALRSFFCYSKNGRL